MTITPLRTGTVPLYVLLSAGDSFNASSIESEMEKRMGGQPDITTMYVFRSPFLFLKDPPPPKLSAAGGGS